ncbi:hypothetical protein EDB92DRAFT_1917182 [Lactarius akahatsu]|uniref:Uncharacterized protein n=1 Tax=Lactarius akahatsu TaxID=416441 RepID=A0AAD4L841_9AGAM|nr:hypothetical protein EDB92DRAFT_1917182 [Lactarius akahatsu]
MFSAKLCEHHSVPHSSSSSSLPCIISSVVSPPLRISPRTFFLHISTRLHPNRLTSKTAEQMITSAGRFFSSMLRNFFCLPLVSRDENVIPRAVCYEQGRNVTTELFVAFWIGAVRRGDGHLDRKKKSLHCRQWHRKRRNSRRESNRRRVCDYSSFSDAALLRENDCFGRDTGISSVDGPESAAMQGRGFEAGRADEHART